MTVGIVLRWIKQVFFRTKVRHISAPELMQRLGGGEVIVYDATMPAQWKRGHIPGAVYLGFDDRYDPAVLPADKKKMLVFYCESAI